MSTADAVAATRAYFDGWNRHDVDAIVAAVADGYVYDSDANPGPVRGRDGLRGFAETFLGAFPDLAFAVEPVALGDGRVVAEWTVTGTHTGPLMGVPPTGRRFSLRGCDVTRAEGGRLVHTAAYWDSGALFRQLGAAPEEAPTEA
jgi:steroid delta-isomerase-like uncharacterized protein